MQQNSFSLLKNFKNTESAQLWILAADAFEKARFSDY